MSAADVLAVLAELPDEASLPVAYLRELLGFDGATAARGPVLDVDLRVEAVAAALGLAPSTIRGMCAAGRFPGAYRREGREWRIPRAAITAYQTSEAALHQAPPAGTSPHRPKRLDAWRSVAGQGDE